MYTDGMVDEIDLYAGAMIGRGDMFVDILRPKRTNGLFLFSLLCIKR